MVGFEEHLSLLHTLVSFSALSGAARILEDSFNPEGTYHTFMVPFIFYLFCKSCVIGEYSWILKCCEPVDAFSAFTFHIEFVFSKGQVCTIITLSLYGSKNSHKGF